MYQFSVYGNNKNLGDLDFRMTNPIPAPGAAMLAAIGLATLVAKRRSL
jgi:hypothetical protein